MANIKKLVFFIKRQFHPHLFSKEVELAGMNYWPYKHVMLKVCKCGASRILEIK